MDCILFFFSLKRGKDCVSQPNIQFYGRLSPSFVPVFVAYLSSGVCVHEFSGDIEYLESSTEILRILDAIPSCGQNESFLGLVEQDEVSCAHSLA